MERIEHNSLISIPQIVSTLSNVMSTFIHRYQLPLPINTIRFGKLNLACRLLISFSDVFCKSVSLLNKIAMTIIMSIILLFSFLLYSF